VIEYNARLSQLNCSVYVGWMVSGLLLVGVTSFLLISEKPFPFIDASLSSSEQFDFRSKLLTSHSNNQIMSRLLVLHSQRVG